MAITKFCVMVRIVLNKSKPMSTFFSKKREKRRGKMELKQMLREGRQPGEDALLAEEKDL